jgi:hypothetical protein
MEIFEEWGGWFLLGLIQIQLYRLFQTQEHCNIPDLHALQQSVMDAWCEFKASSINISGLYLENLFGDERVMRLRDDESRPIDAVSVLNIHRNSFNRK